MSSLISLASVPLSLETRPHWPYLPVQVWSVDKHVVARPHEGPGVLILILIMLLLIVFSFVTLISA